MAEDEPVGTWIRSGLSLKQLLDGYGSDLSNLAHRNLYYPLVPQHIGRYSALDAAVVQDFYKRFPAAKPYVDQGRDPEAAEEAYQRSLLEEVDPSDLRHIKTLSICAICGRRPVVISDTELEFFSRFDIRREEPVLLCPDCSRDVFERQSSFSVQSNRQEHGQTAREIGRRIDDAKRLRAGEG